MNDSVLSGNLIEKFAEFISRIAGAVTSDELEKIRIEATGKTGFYTLLKKDLGKIADIEERKKSGQRFNDDAARIEAALKTRKEEISIIELNARLSSETIDVTLPPSPQPLPLAPLMTTEFV